MMKLTVSRVMFVALLLGCGIAVAQHKAQNERDGPLAPPSSKVQSYAGQDARAVAMLSPEDVENFFAGRGMGLAKSAELNGYPGPMHVLEHEGYLALTADQKVQVIAAFDTMKATSISLGQHYVAAEQAVDDALKSKASAETVATRVAAAYKVLGEIRMAHLTAHLQITPLLTDVQRAKYAELRGYTSGQHDPSKHKH
jgi:hypothetical protein